MASSVTLRFLTVAPSTKHTASIIFIHGLGDSGYGWESVADMLQKNPTLNHIKWILPHAGRTPITANGGVSMPAWFDIKDFTFKTEDEEGMLKSSFQINSLIAEEINGGIPADRIVLGGFSQGGAMTLLTGLTADKKFAGLAVLSGWLPIREKIRTMISGHAETLPIFWGHGEEDPLVTFDIAVRSKEFLTANFSIPEAPEPGSAGLSFNPYKGMAHEAGLKELNDLKLWLEKVIPK